MAEFVYNQEHTIKGKIIIHADIINVSPVVIGSGREDIADVEIMRLPDNQPYIPASSFAGALQYYFTSWKIAPGSGDDKFSKDGSMFWGSEQKKKEKKDAVNNKAITYQSHILFDDLYTCDSKAKKKIVIRDGVKINAKTNTAENKGKYDYEILEAGVTFHLRAEITIRQGMNETGFMKYVEYIESILHDDQFRIGAQNNTGFGKIKCDNFKAWHFKFGEPVNNRVEWFEYLKRLNQQDIRQNTYYEIIPAFKPINSKIHENPNQPFCIDASFVIKNSLIIGSYGIDSNDPDKSHLKSWNTNINEPDNVLSGKSIRGAIRHRALKILNTLEVAEADKIIRDLFGYVENDKTQKKVEMKGRIRIEESFIKNVAEQTQNRIRIDRFTGGTMKNALFNSKPVWKTGTANNVQINLSIENFKDWEAVLLLHTLKDLWTEDLAIGGEKNIGRGVLTGQNATISVGKKQLILKQIENGELVIDGEVLRSEIKKWEVQFNSLVKI